MKYFSAPRITKCGFSYGLEDHLSLSRRPPVVRGADFGNHWYNAFITPRASQYVDFVTELFLITVKMQVRPVISCCLKD
jgi:hypothetical protein